MNAVHEMQQILHEQNAQNKLLWEKVTQLCNTPNPHVAFQGEAKILCWQTSNRQLNSKGIQNTDGLVSRPLGLKVPPTNNLMQVASPKGISLLNVREIIQA